MFHSHVRRVQGFADRYDSATIGGLWSKASLFFSLHHYSCVYFLNRVMNVLLSRTSRVFIIHNLYHYLYVCVYVLLTAMYNKSEDVTKKIGKFKRIQLKTTRLQHLTSA